VELTNEFRVGVPVDEAWAVLTTVERIAPCLPGAQLEEVEGDEYRGVVKVKVGPITAQYKGTATFLEQDAVAHRAVLRAEGRDTRGQGNASATVTATLTPDGSGTAVTVVTDLTITGKVAQFGRGVLADVSGKLIGQFVENLERDVLSAAPAGVRSTLRPGDAPTNGAARSTLRPGQVTAPPASEAPTIELPALEDSASESSAPASSAPASSAPGSPAVDAPPRVAEIRRIDAPEAAPVDLLATAGTPVARRVVPVVLGVLVLALLFRRRRRRRRAGSA
jgi:hypothetical protein